MSLGIVVPTLNEERALPLLLRDVSALAEATSLDLLVCDGGSTDGTIERALAAGARIVRAPAGRAQQLNRGARAAQGAWLLFLHADSRLSDAARDALRDAVAGPPRFEAAIFRFAIDLPPVGKLFIETGQALREAHSGLAYGDQGLLVRRGLIEAVGGYPELPLMEDVALLRTLRHRTRVARLPAALVTSGRRYRERGVVRTWLRHTALISLYLAGVSPAQLAQWSNA